MSSFLGCSLFKGKESSLSINSSPAEAKISILTSDGNYKELGTTPFKSQETLGNDKSDFIILKIEKSGYSPEILHLEKQNHKSIEYRAVLKELDTWNDKDLEKSSFVANKLASKMQNINALVWKKDYDKALLGIKALIEQYPKASTFFDIEGSIYLLRNQKKEAIASYERSLSLEPNKVETKKIIQKLKENN